MKKKFKKLKKLDFQILQAITAKLMDQYGSKEVAFRQQITTLEAERDGIKRKQKTMILKGFRHKW